MRENVLELRNVTKKYRLGEDVYALRNASLTVKEGEFLVIVGASGSGKSTLLHIMGALDRPTEGTVKISGQDIKNFSDSELAEVRGKMIGFVFQTFNLISRLTVLENVLLPAYFVNHDKRGRAEQLIKSVGLQDRIHHTASQLSGGECQRVAIARALINEPKIILADEPTGNLDSNTGKRIMEVFTALNAEGKTIILITHDQNIAKSSKRRIIIKDGVIQK